MTDKLQQDKATLSNSWIGEVFVTKKLSAFGPAGVEWGKRIRAVEGRSLGLRHGLFARCPSREFTLTLAGAIAVHRKSSVRHVPISMLADYVDSPFDYSNELGEIEDTGILCITDFFSHESKKNEVFPPRTRYRIETLVKKRMDAQRGVLLHTETLEPCDAWWRASFVASIEKLFESISL